MTNRVPLIINAGSAQIQELPTADALSVVGNILLGNIVNAGSNAAGSIGSTTGWFSNSFVVTTFSTTVSATANVIGGNVTTAGLVTATGNVTGGNITTGGLITATGNITGANLIVNGTAAAGSGVLLVSGNIQTTTANSTANIGNVSNYFNTVHAKATTAQYADVAEYYLADTEYQPGTVLIFGGDREVTARHASHDPAVAGVVSENPSHLMNAGLRGDYVVPVALLGRVKCQVIEIGRAHV